MLRNNNLSGFGGRRGEGITPGMNFTLTSSLTDAVNRSTYDLNSIPIGDPYSDRWFGCLCIFRGSNNDNDMTLTFDGGAPDYTQEQASTVNSNDLILGYSKIISGTTIDVSCSLSGGNADGAVMQAFYFRSTQTNPKRAAQTNTSTLGMANGGAAIFGAQNSNKGDIDYTDSLITKLIGFDTDSNDYATVGAITNSDGTNPSCALTENAARLAVSFEY